MYHTFSQKIHCFKDIFIAQYDFIEDPYFYYSNINNNANSSNNNQNNTENNVIINTETNNNQNTINYQNKNLLINHGSNNQINSVEDNINMLLSLGITHIITFTSCHKKALKNKFLLYNLNEDINYYQNQNLVFNNNNIDLIQTKILIITKIKI